jgi:small subunit ribosomal protein S9
VPAGEIVATTEPGAEPGILPREPAGPPGKSYFWGTGRRKRAVARVRVRPGDGTFKVNGRALEDYFHLEKDRQVIAKPLEATGTQRKVDVFVNVRGGGTTGQTGAVALGIARALKKCNPDYEPALREGNFLTRDSRKVERKKYGQRGARRRFQFSKR